MTNETCRLAHHRNPATSRLVRIPPRPAFARAAVGTVIAAFLAAQSFAVEPKDLATLQVGQPAPADIITPFALAVVDPEATAAAREREGLKVPAIFRHDPALAERSIAEFQFAFARTRRHFAQAAESYFGSRRAIPSRVNSPAFRQFRAWYQTNNPAFPITPSLAHAWATGETGADLEARLVAVLRDALGNRRIRPDEIPAETKPGAPQWRVAVIPRAAEPRDRTDLAETDLLPWAELHPVNRVRNEIRKRLVTEDRQFAGYLADLVRANCEPDLELTRAIRADRTASVWVADHYVPGQVIVKEGQAITPRLKAALDELAARSAVPQLQRRNRSLELIAWSAGTAAAVGLTLLAGIVWARRRETAGAVGPLVLVRSTRDLLPPGTAGEAVGLELTPASDRPEALGRGGFLAQMGRLLANRLVRGLIVQREHLLEIQRRAGREIAELERRLEEMQAPMQERLNAYERRISDLERQLALRDAENAELIQATIFLAKQKIAEAKSDARVDWN